jgi:hypothetical protein
MYVQDVFEMKYAHTPSESPPPHAIGPSAGKSTSQKSTAFVPTHHIDNDTGDDSEEEREKRLKELQDQVSYSLFATSPLLLCRLLHVLT